MDVVDVHQHFWWRDQARYAWLDSNDPVLYRDFTPEDLQLQLQAARVQHTIVVQADPSVEETLLLLDLAEQTAFVVGVVGRVDLEHLNVVRLGITQAYLRFKVDILPIAKARGIHSKPIAARAAGATDPLS